MTPLGNAEVVSGLDKSVDTCLPCWTVSPMRQGVSFVCSHCTATAYLAH